MNDLAFYKINGIPYVYSQKTKQFVNLNTNTQDKYVVYGEKLKVFNIDGVDYILYWYGTYWIFSNIEHTKYWYPSAYDGIGGEVNFIEKLDDKIIQLKLSNSKFTILNLNVSKNVILHTHPFWK